eukprot:TRINITY_DN4433_c0_g1_i1.p1 TRINITY_DN4433_c0_g1~~TRINITY_DN4433_c0_g1_i1.p1  ORF type:complete len:172 (+),score=6.53 TRINITY_DN4433_c0_g1_i1:77-592(+)
MSRSDKWSLDYSSTDAGTISDKCQPVGYITGPVSKAIEATGSTGEQERQQLKHKAAWQVVTKQLMNLPMSLFMMWMMGNNLSIWTFGFLGYLMYNPIRALFNVNNEFKRFQDGPSDNYLLHKASYMLVTLVYLALGAWKCSGMGLIPSSQADWLEFVQIGLPKEVSLGSLL